jgi:hypothetical protein
MTVKTKRTNDEIALSKALDLREKQAIGLRDDPESSIHQREVATRTLKKIAKEHKQLDERIATRVESRKEKIVLIEGAQLLAAC